MRMPTERAIKTLLIPLAIWLARPLRANDQDAQLRALVDQVLDQNIKQIRIENLPIRQALVRVEEQTGLRFLVPDTLVERMPYGPQTTLSITLEDVPLRRGLAQVLDGLGLEMRVEGDKVRLLPAPVLQRLNRRMTVSEVGLLAMLARAPWAALDHSKIPVRFEIDPQTRPQEEFEKALGQQAQAPNALRQLEAATRALGWVWLPEGETLVVCDRREFARRKLEEPLDVSYQHVALDELLEDLGRKIGVPVLFEPDALRRVSARDRFVDLVQRQTSARQILERLCGNTGLRYEVTADGLRVAGPASAESAPARAPGAGPVVARISVPFGSGGATIDFLYREDELPPEFRQLREEKLRELLQELRKMKEGQAP